MRTLEEIQRLIPIINWKIVRSGNIQAGISGVILILYRKGNNCFECIYLRNETNFSDDLYTKEPEEVLAWVKVKTKFNNFI